MLAVTLQTALGKVAWAGRTASMVFGLALILALLFGVASMALGANGNPFLLGKSNAATALTKLTGNVNGAAMQVGNSNAGATDTALSLSVQAGEAPMRVNSPTKVANLNADRIDDREASSFANAAHAHAGEDITSGTVEADFVEDGAGSNLNADQIDGVDSAAFWRGNTYTLYKSVSGTANGTTYADHTCNSGDKLLSGGYYMSGTGFEVFVDTPYYNTYYLYWKSGATANSAELYVNCADF